MEMRAKLKRKLGGMEGIESSAAKMVVQIMLSKEECAGSMGRSRNDAAVKDAQTIL